MKNRVLFLAPAIQAGSGGVADYSRRLAHELSSPGLECHLASWTEEKMPCGPETEGIGELYLGRAGAAPREKCLMLAEYISRLKIDWVSLQFVSYGFQPRGLVGNLGRAIEPLADLCKWHVFFHELWLGEQHGATAYESAIGWLQKRQILRLLDRLRPAGVWTNVGYYQRRLAEQNVPSSTVPIFGNFPFTEGREDDWLTGLANEATGNHLQREQYYFAGIFGTVYPIWPFQRVIPPLAKRAKGMSRTLVLVFFGKNRCEPETISQMKSLPDAAILNLGELDAARVDRVMRTMDVALTTTPSEAVFKSGGAVAFLERGIPTIAVPGMLEGNQKQVIEDHPCLIIADADFEQNLDRAGEKRQPQSLLPAVAECYRKLFLEQLSTAGLH